MSETKVIRVGAEDLRAIEKIARKKLRRPVSRARLFRFIAEELKEANLSKISKPAN